MKFEVLKAITIKLALFMACDFICYKCTEVLDYSSDLVLKLGDSVAGKWSWYVLI